MIDDVRRLLDVIDDLCEQRARDEDIIDGEFGTSGPMFRMPDDPVRWALGENDPPGFHSPEYAAYQRLRARCPRKGE